MADKGADGRFTVYYDDGFTAHNAGRLLGSLYQTIRFRRPHRLSLRDALNAPDLIEKLRAGDQTVVGSTPSESAAMLAADPKKWGAVARRIQLGLD